ncbi:tripartite tricarboxylate transporter substrate binding protein [Rhizobiaceae bacterium BDR2-2]|uniref:Tripartite tricarboxylate transporter substrate binding protein n=1 Tax=Ectorhizobium quercum TaxID=2965071 RepID=A0AAE3SUN6_9HYPH|nr:tripartite tricarboxylate transporter substrate binding protein [Ectorhizobium quercum]MCX8997430.1 tripartite tricarboxylate transporter substrate binding protein [Ectorhizobium quercum]
MSVISVLQRLAGRMTVATVAALGLSAASGEAVAQSTYPARPVTIVVGAGPGGGNDVAARLIADYLSRELEQPFVVENRPGASGARASEYVVAQPADGYTLLLGNTATQIYNSMLLADSTFDPNRDTVLAGMFGQSTNLLVVNPQLPVNSVADLVALAKSKPGELNFGSAGNGGSVHLSGEYFRLKADIDVVHVPFKSGAEMATDIIAGTTDFAVDNLPTSYSFVVNGQLKALAVTSEKRWPTLPDVPTMAEAGFPDFNVLSFYGLFARTGTDPEILAKIDAAVEKFISDKDEGEAKLDRIGAIPFRLEPADYSAFIDEQSKVWRAMIAAAGIEEVKR